MDDSNAHINRFSGRRPFELDDDAIIEFLGIGEGMSVLDVGGADGFYARKFAARKATVTMIDAHDYNFKELNALGINTIQKDFCSYDKGRFDMIFMAHVYHDLVYYCRESLLKNLSRVSTRHIANLDFTKTYSGFGPPVSMRLDKEEVERDMKSIGFSLKKSQDIPYHYLQLFERA